MNYYLTFLTYRFSINKYIVTKNLPNLEPAQMVEPIFIEYNSKKTKTGKSKYSYMGQTPTSGGNEVARRLRSKTPDGLADAMAEQWGKVL